MGELVARTGAPAVPGEEGTDWPIGSEPLPTADASGGAAEDDPLAEIDHLMRERLDDLRRSADESARLAADRSEFSSEFEAVCVAHVRPPMEEIIERLRRNGGGGLIAERPEDPSRQYTHRLTMWMSLSGEILGPPRQDRHPYLQLDADVEKRLVVVSEGDMWQGHGGNHAGRVAEWQLSEVTAALVTQEVLAILRRSLG
jgi:hypothetical protein